jgi:thermostable 8-oxoguanine DNA glycosylase
MQTMYSVINGGLKKLILPAPNEIVFSRICWGAFDELLTPAYWKGQVWQHLQLGTYSDLRLGRSLSEEIAACLLGGYGMPADLALAAYWRVRECGILATTPAACDIEKILERPFLIEGNERKYRFIRQKARYLSACLEMLQRFDVPQDDYQFRENLAELPGIGLKTASWIVRNMRPQCDIAIIDVHILRAGRTIGLFPGTWTPQKNYLELERRFVSFAHALDVAPTMLDALMWDYMRRLPDAILNRVPVRVQTQMDLFNSASAHELATA